jgi:hypothetical protein
MSHSVPAPIVEVVQLIVRDLVNGNFQELEVLSKGVRLTASEMEEAVRQYGEKLLMPPDSAFQSIDVIQVRGAEPRQWSVRFDLWTESEGQSDLSLEMTVIEGNVGQPLRVEIDNLHVP